MASTPAIQFLRNVLVPQVSVDTYVMGMLSSAQTVQVQQLLDLQGLSYLFYLLLPSVNVCAQDQSLKQFVLKQEVFACMCMPILF